MSDRQAEAVRRLKALGFEALAADHGEEAGRALAAAETMAARLPEMVEPAPEPALVFRATGADGEAGNG